MRVQYLLWILATQFGQLFGCDKQTVEDGIGLLNELSQQLVTTTSPTGQTSCRCGKANTPKIVGGELAHENEFPWQVGIKYSGLIGTLSPRPFCGGTIISDQEILTAAHCTRSKTADQILVMIGEHNTGVDTTVDHTVTVKEIIEHPSYVQETTNYDFSVLRLSQPLTFTREVGPACLPDIQGQGSQYEGKASTISGWGTTSSGGSQSSTLLKATVISMSNSECCSGTKYTCAQITDQMICASAPNTDSCQGDSGGPLTLNEGGSYTLYGVVSWGYGCAQASAHGVYARVTNQLDWIKNNMVGATCPRL